MIQNQKLDVLSNPHGDFWPQDHFQNPSDEVFAIKLSNSLFLGSILYLDSNWIIRWVPGNVILKLMIHFWTCRKMAIS